MIGLNEGTGSMTLAFASPISGFLAQVSWSKRPLLTATMSAVGSGDVALEAWVFSSDGSNLLTPEGFYGFSRASNDIVAIRFENDFIGARDMSYSRIAQGNVPVPGVLALLGIGLLGLGGLRRVARAGA
jgi:membrane protein required for beta-lactamase induction